MFDAFDYELEEMSAALETAEEMGPETDNPETEECEIEKECADFREISTEFLREEQKCETEAEKNSNDFEKEFFQGIHRISTLSNEETEALLSRVSLGGAVAEEAKAELEQHNLPFIDFIYCKYFKNCSLERADAFQEGFIALRRAIGMYNIQKGVKFSTYAAASISRAIKRAEYEQKNCIRLPESRQSNKYKVLKEETDLTMKLGHYPTAAEIASELGMTAEEVERTKLQATAELTFDAEIESEDSIITYGQLFADPEVNIEEEFIENELRNTLLNAMASLSEIEQMVTNLHFGLYDGCAMSYSEIATRLTEMGYPISVSRVNQIGREALSKLANNRKWGKKLRGFLTA